MTPMETSVTPPVKNSSGVPGSSAAQMEAMACAMRAKLPPKKKL